MNNFVFLSFFMRTILFIDLPINQFNKKNVNFKNLFFSFNLYVNLLKILY
jgi:hypothetical protein